MSDMIISGSAGERLVNAIESKKIVKDYRPNHGRNFHGAYEELYLYKFRVYLGSVGRAIRNSQLKKENYYGY